MHARVDEFAVAAKRFVLANDPVDRKAPGFAGFAEGAYKPGLKFLELFTG